MDGKMTLEGLETELNELRNSVIGISESVMTGVSCQQKLFLLMKMIEKRLDAAVQRLDIAVEELKTTKEV